MTEIWKDVRGYEGKYQVSNLGRVKSVCYNNTKQPKLMKPMRYKAGGFHWRYKGVFV